MNFMRHTAVINDCCRVSRLVILIQSSEVGTVRSAVVFFSSSIYFSYIYSDAA